MNRSSRLALAAALVTLVVPALAAADPVPYSLAETAVISDPSGNARVLIKPGDLSALEGRLITSARLTFTLPGQISARELPVRVYPLTSDWTAASASWTSPWKAAGGDFDDAYYETATIAAGARATQLSLDVAPIVRAMVEGEYGKHDFLLTVPAYDGIGFRGTDLATLGTLTAATLEVDSRRSIVQEKAAAARRGGS